MSSQFESPVFNASMFVTEQLNRQLINIAQDLAERCVKECGIKYNFDAEEAIRFLGLSKIRMERKSPVKEKEQKMSKVVTPKTAFPLPYNGEFHDSCCYALRQNNGLYTQCTSLRKGTASFCKGCANQMQKIGAEVPEYGTIQQRKAVGILEYVDPKGRKPTAFCKIMKKYNLTKDSVLEEASKVSIIVDDIHFDIPEDTKRGRPKAEKEVKEKGTKGRPKKEKKVLLIDGDDDDLFAALVAEANETDDESVLPKKKSQKSDEDKEAERLAKEAEKAEKEAKKLAEKEAREAKLAQDKADREAKKAAEEQARAAKKASEEEARAAKKAAEEEARAAKKLAEEQAKAEKEAKKSKKEKKVAEPVVEKEQEKVKKIEFEGKKYLKSKTTGIIYDFESFVQEGEQVVIGKWSDADNKIIFNKPSDEESEDEYDV